MPKKPRKGEMSSNTDDEPRVTLASHDRLLFVHSLVKKKANAALSGVGGTHFRVFPPQEFLDRPEAIKSEGILDTFKDTVWWVKWYDGNYDQLTFEEFLVFIDGILRAERAFKAAVTAHKSVASKLGMKKTKRVGAWQPKKDRSKKSKSQPIAKITVNDMVDLVAMAKDASIRAMLGVVELERTTRPPEAVN